LIFSTARKRIRLHTVWTDSGIYPASRSMVGGGTVPGVMRWDRATDTRLT